MIVREHDPRSAVPQGIGNDRPNGEGRVPGRALVPGEVQAPAAIVQVRNPQALSSRVGLCKATREEGAGRFRSVQLERLFGTLIAHPIQLCGRTTRHDSNRVRYRR